MALPKMQVAVSEQNSLTSQTRFVLNIESDGVGEEGKTRQSSLPAAAALKMYRVGVCCWSESGVYRGAGAIPDFGKLRQVAYESVDVRYRARSTMSRCMKSDALRQGANAVTHRSTCLSRELA